MSEFEKLATQIQGPIFRDRNRATGITDLLQTRMNKLNASAGESVKGAKHEIYGKYSTSGNVTAGSAPAVEAGAAPPAARSASNVVRGEPLDTRHIQKSWHCVACDETMPVNQKAAHSQLAYTKTMRKYD